MTGPGPAAPVPVFAVVGHPNKGKSSLVATLAHDERVRIAAEPGTTTRATRYPLKLDGETLYALVDTPGFQRARAALAWMRREAERTSATAADRAAVVDAFCRAPGHDDAFPDEVELLRPILEGAGILYVVDGSVPYGSEYEAEMEILRWTGRPSLAVINPIGSAAHVDEWRAALGQYFKVVRVLDALRADFDKQLDLLRAFGELDEAWRPALQRAVAALESDRARKQRRAAGEIARMLADATQLTVEKRLGRDDDPARFRPELEERYRGELRRVERRGREAVEAVYEFRDLRSEESEDAERETERALLESDLFSERTWLVFGLRTRDLVATGATAGAASGGAIDVAVGGASFLLGALVGGAIGGVLGWLGSGRIAELEVLNRPLGGRLVRMGPARGASLAAVLLGRARLHHALLTGRTHARRDALDLRRDAASGDVGRLQTLERDTLRRLGRALARPADGIAALEGLVAEILARDAAEGGD